MSSAAGTFRQPLNRPSFSRRRVVGLSILFIAFIVAASARAIAGLYTNLLWFRQLGFASVWTTILGTKFLLGAFFTLLFFWLMWFNLAVVDRLAPESRTFSPNEMLAEQIYYLIRPFRNRIRFVVSALLALMAGPAMAGSADQFIRYRNAVSFGEKDPQFSKDIGFYVFRLPFQKSVVSWLFTTLVVVLLFSLFAHYLQGGIRVLPTALRTSDGVKVHVSVLLAVLALLRGADYWLDRYSLTLSTNGYVRGAGNVDVRARIPGLALLALVALVAAVLLFANVRLRTWSVPIIVVGTWLVVSLVVGAIYPRVLEALVKSSQQSRERKYIARNIEATRAAYGLDKVKERELPISTNDAKEREALSKARESLDTVRLLEPNGPLAASIFTKQQQFVNFFSFADTDIDRYVINGKLTPVVLSVRNLNSDVSSDSWVRRHLAYTHGYGVVAASAADVPDGKPAYLLKDLPPVGVPKLTENRVYFGEGLSGYVVGGSKTKEIDYLSKEETKTSSYNGDGGVVLSSLLRKLAFAVRFGDANLLISDQVTSKSQMIFLRGVRERAQQVAPFLKFDADPYPVITKGRVTWVLDGYTTTNEYPYSASAPGAGVVPLGSDLSTPFNYVRNSVKVTIDAFTGQTKYYIVDDRDPIIQSYRLAFPKLFTDASEVPKEIREHFRYPEDLFRVQTSILGRYHNTDPDVLFTGSARWEFSKDPGSAPKIETTVDATTGLPVQRVVSLMAPYYVVGQLPGSESKEFFLQANLVPFSEDVSQQNLKALVIARSDPKHYGELLLLRLPTNEQVDGPSIVADNMSSMTEVSTKETQLGSNGSEITYGSVQVVPVGSSLLFVRPMFVAAKDSRFPVLNSVVVSFRGKIVVADTFEKALDQILGTKASSTSSAATGSSAAAGSANTGSSASTGSKPSASTGTATKPAPTDSGSSGAVSGVARTLPTAEELAALSPDELVRNANRAFTEAQQLPASKLDVYQAKIEEMGVYLAEAERRIPKE